jgi:hypothetical protein
MAKFGIILPMQDEVIDAFVLRRYYPSPDKFLSIETHEAGPRLVYSRNGHRWILAAWLIDEMWITRLWDVNHAIQYEIFYAMSQIHKHLQNRLERLKVDWCWFGDHMTEQAIAEKLMVKTTKGIT